MAEQTKVVAEAQALARGVMPGKGYEIGLLVSQIFHPLFVAIITLFVVGLYSAPTPSQGLGWALLCIALQVVPNGTFFMLRLRQGAYSDSDVSKRQQRTELYLVGLLSMLLGIGVLLWLHAPSPFVKITVAALAITVSCLLINLLWKISVHAATVATCATIVSVFSAGLGVLAWLCALSVGWARIRTGNHSLAQVIAGFAVAALSVVLSFAMVP